MFLFAATLVFGLPVLTPQDIGNHRALQAASPSAAITVGGCENSLWKHPATCTSASSRAYVRCCPADGKALSLCTNSNRFNPKTVSWNEMTYAEAVEECAAWGSQLCSVKELQEERRACGTGCGYDSKAVWTRQTCILQDSPTIEKVPENVMQAAGCPGSSNKADRCAASTSTAGIRCCKDDGSCISTCTPPKFSGIKRLGSSQSDEVTLGEAIAECALQGARLCSTMELQADTCCGTGCNLNHKYVWTHTPCNGQPASLVSPSNVPGLELPTAVTTVAGCATSLSKHPPTCAATTSTAYVRCCLGDGRALSVCANNDFKPQVASQDEMTFAAALAECAAFGSRLCSVEELKDEGIGCDTGCEIDSKAVWTHEVCSRPVASPSPDPGAPPDPSPGPSPSPTPSPTAHCNKRWPSMFNPAKDFVNLHYDCAPDPDDLMSAVVDRAMLEYHFGREWLKTHTLPVSGTTGTNQRGFNQAMCEAVLSATFNDIVDWLQVSKESWSDVSQTASLRAEQAPKVASIWEGAIRNGGQVYVKEGGQSDFTIMVIRELEQRLPGAGGCVHTVQHSGWNEDKTSPGVLNELERISDYVGTIKNGNGDLDGGGQYMTRPYESAPGPPPPNFWTTATNDSWLRCAWRVAGAWFQTENSYCHGHRNTKVGPETCLDFSDSHETSWILRIAPVDIDKFENKYLNPSRGQDGTTLPLHRCGNANYP